MYKIIELYRRIQKIPPATPTARPLERCNLYVFYIMRPLSFLPTIILHKFNVSPDTATWTGFIVLIISSFLFTVVPSNTYVIIAILVNISFIFDHIDGNLARLYKTTNQYGKFIDGSLDVIGSKILMLCIGYSVYKDTAQINGLLVSVFILWLESSYQYLSFRFIVDKQAKHTISDEKALPVEKKIFNAHHHKQTSISIYNTIKKATRLYSKNMTLVKYPFLIISSYYDMLLYYLLAYASAILIILLPSIIIIFIQAKKDLHFYRNT